MSKIILVSKNNFEEEVLSEKIPVLVDFSTEGCGPCDAIKPILEVLSSEYSGKLKITGFEVTLDEVINDSNDIAKKYNIEGYPTLLIFKNGQVEKTIIGFYPKEELVEQFEEIL